MTLLEKLEAATEGSQELDEEICDHFHVISVSETTGFSVPPVTTSIDAALALARRLYPDCDWTLHSVQKDKNACFTLWPNSTGDGNSIGVGNVEELAIMIALVKAEQANEKH